MIRTILRQYPPHKPLPKEGLFAPFILTLVPEGTRSPDFIGPISGTPRCFVGKGMLIEVLISDSASILIEGRGNQTLHWIDVATLTTQGQHIIPAMSEMRATVRRNTGAVHLIQRP